MGAALGDYSPQYLRERAKQTRAMVSATVCEATLAMLETRAAEYDRMAELLESSAGPKPHTEAKFPNPEKRTIRSEANRVTPI